MEGYHPRMPYHTNSRGQEARGRGFRGGVDLPDSNVEFPLHPRSRFSREVSIDRGDLAVREVGFYSLYGDMSDESRLDVRNDRSYLRSVTVRCAAKGDTSVPDGPWDLDEGFNRTTVQERVKFQRGVSTLLRWTKVCAEDPRVQELASERVDFVSTNSTMGHLMKVAYQRDSRSDDGWIFAAAKVNGWNLHHGITTTAPFGRFTVSGLGPSELVQENCRGGRMTLWDPNLCLGFLCALLKYVQATVIKDHNSAVYEFSCAKDGAGFSNKEIPTRDAIGHEYLTEDIDSFVA